MKAALKGIALMAAVLGLLVASLLVINGFTNPTQSIGILQGIATTLVSLAATFAVVGALAAVFGKFKSEIFTHCHLHDGFGDTAHTKCIAGHRFFASQKFSYFFVNR